MNPAFLVATLVTLLLLPACGTPRSIAGREWPPVNVVTEPDATVASGVTLHLPGSPAGRPERVDPERFLIVAVHYDGCHLSDARLAGQGRDRLEVRFTELFRQCVRPIPTTAWFAIPWDELPDTFVVVDQAGDEQAIRDRQRVG